MLAFDPLYGVLATIITGGDMITQISLENFKVFKQLKGMEIKPVTILCGTNSCGKSSILQSILLIRQTLESQISKQALLLNGGLVHLGIFENIIFEKKLDREVSFEFSFKTTKNDLSQGEAAIQKNGAGQAQRASQTIVTMRSETYCQQNPCRKQKTPTFTTTYI